MALVSAYRKYPPAVLQNASTSLSLSSDSTRVICDQLLENFANFYKRTKWSLMMSSSTSPSS